MDRAKESCEVTSHFLSQMRNDIKIIANVRPRCGLTLLFLKDQERPTICQQDVSGARKNALVDSDVSQKKFADK